MPLAKRIPDLTYSRALYRGVFDGVEHVKFGLAGELSPISWELAVICIGAPQADSTVQYELSIHAQMPDTPHGNVVGNFGYPEAGVMADYSYGYGAAGRIGDLPAVLIDQIEKDTGLTLDANDDEEWYEWSYSSDQETLKPAVNNSDVTWWISKADAELSRLKDERDPSETFLVRRLRPVVERYSS